MMRDGFENRIFVLDGAMGTQLQQLADERGLGLHLMGEDAPERLNLTHPELVREIHRRYLAAGSDGVLTNSFGGNAVRLGRFGLAEQLAELNRAAVENARRAGARWVVGSVGPTGEMSAPMGGFSFDDFYRALYPQIRVLLEAGVNAIALETMMDVVELKAAVKAVRDLSWEIPLIAQVSLMRKRMLQGTDLPAVAVMLEAMGVDMIGMNCVPLSEECVGIVRETAAVTHCPLIVQPNAGLPDSFGHYQPDLREWERVMRLILQTPGVGAVGGCCGTNPEVIRLLRRLADEVGERKMSPAASGVTCLSGRMGVLTLDRTGGPYLAGECLNPSGRPDLQEAMREEDWFRLGDEGLAQVEAGAVLLDVNVGLAGIDQERAMAGLVRQLQMVTDVPLILDASDPAVLEAGLKVYAGKPVINSCHAGEESLEQVLPLARRYGAAIVGLCMDENGVPGTAEERVGFAKAIVTAAARWSIPEEDIFLDPLVVSAVMGTGSGVVLETLAALRRETGCRTIAGVSNVSYGLPDRALLNRVFLAMGLGHGLEVAIANPKDAKVAAAVHAARLLLGNDPDCTRYLRFCRGRGRR